jgi:hypothetical protein
VTIAAARPLLLAVFSLAASARADTIQIIDVIDSAGFSQSVSVVSTSSRVSGTGDCPTPFFVRCDITVQAPPGMLSEGAGGIPDAFPDFMNHGRLFESPAGTFVIAAIGSIFPGGPAPFFNFHFLALPVGPNPVLCRDALDFCEPARDTGFQIDWIDRQGNFVFDTGEILFEVTPEPVSMLLLLAVAVTFIVTTRVRRPQYRCPPHLSALQRSSRSYR